MFATSRTGLNRISIKSEGVDLAWREGKISPEDSEAFRHLVASANVCDEMDPDYMEAIVAAGSSIHKEVLKRIVLCSDLVLLLEEVARSTSGTELSETIMAKLKEVETRDFRLQTLTGSIAKQSPTKGYSHPSQAGVSAGFIKEKAMGMINGHPVLTTNDMIERARNSGQIDSIHAEATYEGKTLVAVTVTAQTKKGEKKKVMSRTEIETEHMRISNTTGLWKSHNEVLARNLAIRCFLADLNRTVFVGWPDQDAPEQL